MQLFNLRFDMNKVKSTVGAKLLGYAIMALVLFTVFFDPTAMALGTKYVTLSASTLTVAEVVGNFTWIFGVIYLLVVIGAGCVVFTDEALAGAIKTATEKDTLKAFRPVWYKTLLSYLSIGLSLVAIGSGFWFVGTTWFLAILMLKGMMARIRKTDEFTAWYKEYKAG